MGLFNASRSNLLYQVFEKQDEEEKYNTLRSMIEEKNCPTIIYVSRTRKAEALAQRLTQDGYQGRAYHGQMDKQEKTENQDLFMRGEIQIMVATSAFGMGVDKTNTGHGIPIHVRDCPKGWLG